MKPYKELMNLNFPGIPEAINLFVQIRPSFVLSFLHSYILDMNTTIE